MSGRFQASLPASVTKTTLYRAVGWLFRAYVASLLVVGGYSLLWILEIAGMLPAHLLSTAWIGMAAMGVVFLVISLPLYYAARTADR
ncbi:hypothetical protein [Natrinema longum]|uniref:Uncharacterized protein n=1 Tax=Natrinema longum TaxID=370324 RepID=A0A8A2U7Z0_9EURY|nr:hypothetical protein [Natrinema longum]MBZ6493938.1 hypothetical protein [Natrinema longum]QSW84726.1 hypothetical protein J0X27_14920 [Natrinema longum]